ncbi:MAG TPA: Smr/MutS family protein [Desulfatiglandales bacterium]|nr:Smr/MutS family protein [Desulfatiglandales bacterium]
MSRKRKKDRIHSVKHEEKHKMEFLDKPFKCLTDIKGFNRSVEPVSTICISNNKMEESEDELFRRAMKDVKPLKDDKNKIIRSPAKEDMLLSQLSGSGNKAEDEFSSLIKESSAWDISFSDEYIEGTFSGIGPKIMKRLKRGEFSVQDHIDLHGMTKKEAEAVVSEFLIQSHQKGFRCVLIIHGRGLGSVDNQPAIKRELPIWLKRGILKKIVLAFVTARPCDGGAGASYVLLKR